jgi:hypothetical protein
MTEISLKDGMGDHLVRVLNVTGATGQEIATDYLVEAEAVLEFAANSCINFQGSGSIPRERANAARSRATARSVAAPTTSCPPAPTAARRRPNGPPGRDSRRPSTPPGSSPIPWRPIRS